MEIREARPEDNEELQLLQARCPQGTGLIYSVVNTPDFFARAKAYDDYKVYTAVEDRRIIGSGACAIRSVLVNGSVEKVGYMFQAFVDPNYRGKQLAGQLYRTREDYLREKGAALVYTIVMKGNLPSIHHISRQGFQLHRTLSLKGLAVFKRLPLDTGYKIRTANIKDLPVISDLINQTWKDYELYEMKSTVRLQRLISRTPGYQPDNLFLLEEGHKILACLGYWDWSQIIRMTVQKLIPKMKFVNLLLDTARFFKPMPYLPRPGQLIRQIILTPIAFKNPQHLTPLLRHINNLALQKKFGYIYCICEKDHPIVASMKGFFRSDTAVQVYVKYLKDNVLLSDKPVFIDGIDA
jgi:GNAT superfamily N-acetyltransferase